MIQPVSYNYHFYPVRPASLAASVRPVDWIQKMPPLEPRSASKVVKTGPSECSTCKNRKYVDGSNENVSFKTPAHISPEASFALVSAHEGEHVANAVSKGNEPGARLISASVKLQMERCPECGTPYIAGGETRTMIRYQEQNPYERNRKSLEGSLLKGMNVDYVA